MTTTTLPRWLLPAALATGLAAMLAIPAPARANDDLVRVIVDIADVVLRDDAAYYRHGNYGRNDRLIVSRDRYGRPVYYRTVPRYQNVHYRPAPPRYASGHAARGKTSCDRRGRCTVQYYDPRQDRSNRRDWRR
ncbi:hypothetical protein LDO26_02755 [Luteimonas sp. BDR2-5]|uniref:hypothetical protein n=1 Tax=Proluteimonas luteida TaxID=2878685 RepID=UPI001E5439A8|nr:hypothetical protein [Luteimonas sp. BDR2-5]MCD9027134.1 hypothetical protein [Luteimonas sp. BDR2-5]